MTGSLADRVAAELAAPVTAPVTEFARHLAFEAGPGAGRTRAMLFYGSNLRTGALDGVLDYYALLDGDAEGGIWPRVSYHEWPHGGTILRAKLATMNLATFREAAAGRRLDTTVWARFCQPCALVWSSGPQAAMDTAEAVSTAIQTAARLSAALGPGHASEEEFWRGLFAATYAAEFRVEKAGRGNSILAMNRDHFSGLLPLALDAGGIGFSRQGDSIAPQLLARDRKQALAWWHRRRRLGKAYNLVRLIRATTTFDGAARYAAWKIERHTGVSVPLTPWRERHPLLSAPGLLWHVWRRRKHQPGRHRT